MDPPPLPPAAPPPSPTWEEEAWLLVEEAAEGFWQIDGQRRTSHVNRALCRMLGYNREEMLGRSPLEFADEDNQAIFRAQMARIPDEANRDYHITLRHKDGHPVPAAFHATTLWDAAGCIRASYAFITDRGPELRSLAALRESEQRFRGLFEQLPTLAVQGYDRERRVVYWNAASERLYGYSAREARGQRLEDLIIPAEMRTHVVSAIQAWIDEDQPIPAGELHLLRRDGRRVPVYSSHVLQRTSGGDVLLFCLDMDLQETHALQRALRDSEARYRIMVETANEGICAVNDESIVTFVNPSLAHSLGYRPEDLIGRSAADFMAAEDMTAHQDVMRHRREGLAGRYERRLRHRNGEWRWMHVSSAPLRDGQGRFLGSIGMLLDITEQKRAEEAQRLAAAVFSNAAEGVTITDPEGHILAVNSAFSRITGYSEAEVLGHTPRVLKSGRHDLDFYQDMWQSLTGTGQWRGEIWNRRKSGDVYPEWLTISAVRDDRGLVQNYVAVFTDISQLKQSEAELNRLAYHDPLTGLPNRLLFRDRLEHALQRAKRDGQRLAVMFLDLDRFKNVNDSLGHYGGDQMLLKVASRLRERLRASDTLARLGGDEFMVLVEQIGGDDEVSPVARDLLGCFHHPIAIQEHEAYITASIGISLYPDDGADVDTLIMHADTAMYRAKEAGRNTYQFYNRDFTHQARQRFSLEAALHRALERNEFELHYQSQQELGGGRLVGLEALLRWRHPELGMVAPDQFIPLAEESGLILPIGEWVLERACQDLRDRIHPLVPGLVVAVNLSVPEIERGDPVRRVGRVLDATGLPPACLELEITESSAMRRGEDSLAVLQGLRALGVSLAIDDFGSGYSNLGYLKRLPVTRVKIDRQFVRDLPDDPEDAAITRAIIALAHSLKLRVVAEGVETAAQRDYLIGQGCDLIQGYYCSRPMPLETVLERLRDQAIRCG